MSRLPPKDLIGFLKPYDHAVRELALLLRELVLEEMVPCHENIYDAYSAVAIGYGPTDRVGDGVCHIAVYTNHVNLGFNYGTRLDDPRGILKGTGKWIRHLTMTQPDDLKRPEIRGFLRLARALSDPPMARRKKSGEVVSVVKVIYAKKRRPK